MISLSVLAIVCLVVFQGHTESLIPLYAIGVFIPFTLALIGLVKHHWWTAKMMVPLIAVIFTSTVVITLVITKWFVIWPVLLFVPLLIVGCLNIKKHYNHVEHLLFNNTSSVEPYKSQIMLIPISGYHQLTKKALQIATLQQCNNIYALYIGSTKEDIARMQQIWQKEVPSIRLIAITSSHQQILQPLLRTIVKINALAQKNQRHVIVAIPQLTMQSNWHNTLHNHHAFALKQSLLKYPDISVLTIAYEVQ